MPDTPSTQPPGLNSPLSRDEVLSVRTPLRFVFWGLIICFVEIKFDRVDLVHDAVGAILLAVGVAGLWKLPMPGRYRLVSRIAFVGTMFTALTAIIEMMPHGARDPLLPVKLVGYAGEWVSVICISDMFHLLAAAMMHGSLARYWKRMTMWTIAAAIIAQFLIAAFIIEDVMSGSNLSGMTLTVLAVSVLGYLALLIFQLVGISRLRAAALRVNELTNVCTWCGYDLTSSGGERCPECGVSRWPWRDLQEADASSEGASRP